MKKFLIAISIIIIVIAGYFIIKPTKILAPQPAVITRESVEQHVRDHITTIAPVPPSLGGTWYVTNITYDQVSQTGQVSYEDGHMAHTIAIAVTQTPQGLTITPSDYISLDQGDSGSIHTLRITVNSINDSRCRPDVVCIWQGEAVVEATLTGTAGVAQKHTFKLDSGANSFVFDGVTITLEEVLSVPKGKNGEMGKKAVFEVLLSK